MSNVRVINAHAMAAVAARVATAAKNVATIMDGEADEQRMRHAWEKGDNVEPSGGVRGITRWLMMVYVLGRVARLAMATPLTRFGKK